VDVALRVFRLQEQQLGRDDVRDLVGNGGAEEDDPILEEAREDVEGPLTTTRLFDDDRNQINAVDSLPREY
jgi:hypothetical protein